MISTRFVLATVAAVALVVAGYLAGNTNTTPAAQAGPPKYRLEAGSACIGVDSFEFTFNGYDNLPVRKTGNATGRTLIVDTELEAQGEHILCFPQTYEVTSGNVCPASSYVSLLFVDTYNGVFERVACRTLWFPQPVR